MASDPACKADRMYNAHSSLFLHTCVANRCSASYFHLWIVPSVLDCLCQLSSFLSFLFFWQPFLVEVVQSTKLQPCFRLFIAGEQAGPRQLGHRVVGNLYIDAKPACSWFRYLRVKLWRFTNMTYLMQVSRRWCARRTPAGVQSSRQGLHHCQACPPQRTH